MNVTKYNRLLKSTTFFQDFEDKIASYTNKEKGNIFELLTKYLLQSSNCAFECFKSDALLGTLQSDYIFNFKKVYLYDEKNVNFQ